MTTLFFEIMGYQINPSVCCNDRGHVGEGEHFPLPSQRGKPWEWSRPATPIVQISTGRPRASGVACNGPGSDAGALCPAPPAAIGARSAIRPAIGTAAIPAASGSRARPTRDVRSAHLPSFRGQKIIFGLSIAFAGREHRPPTRRPFRPPDHLTRALSPPRPTAAFSSCPSASDEPQTHSPPRQSSDPRCERLRATELFFAEQRIRYELGSEIEDAQVIAAAGSTICNKHFRSVQVSRR
jgi:hypothetical protein